MYKKIKEIVESGHLGQIMSVQSTESLGLMHGASYMRRWHRKIRNSGGFMLAKCSHDLDLLNWIIDSVPVRVASFGNINFFKPDKQSAAYCSQCPDESCRFRFKGEMVVMSDREKESPSDQKFDLCVYNDDKDIVDNQVSILEYANGVNAAFALNLFAPRGKRTMTIVGTEGYLDADTENCLIKITSSLGLPDEEISCNPTNDSGHGGSDLLFFEEFLNNINTGMIPKADYQAGIITTVVGNALEKARLSGKNVKISPSEYKI
jgi:predicted dehydrogenase